MNIDKERNRNSFEEQLRQYTRVCSGIQWKKEEIRRLRDAALPGSPALGMQVNNGSAGSRVENVSVRIADCEKELEALKCDMQEMYAGLLESIGQLDKPLERRIMLGFCLDGLSLNDIADRENVSYSTVYKTKRSAITHLNSKNGPIC